MGVEVERKYLVNNQKWEKVLKGEKHFIRQGYILNDPSKTVRIRLKDNQGYLTIKGSATGASRPEFEYPLPAEDAKELLDNFCDSEIRKIRNKIYYKEKLWEVDEFLGDNEGLVIAEIELSNEEELFHIPDWIDAEVTGENKYYNSNLSVHPFTKW